jgi:hypothetical protein
VENVFIVDTHIAFRGPVMQFPMRLIRPDSPQRPVGADIRGPAHICGTSQPYRHCRDAAALREEGTRGRVETMKVSCR